jgi:uncharacterized protein
MKKLDRIKCPTCKREGDWFATPYGPFCSKKCKLVDLGKWFGEEQVVSSPLTAENLEDADLQPPETEKE